MQNRHRAAISARNTLLPSSPSSPSFPPPSPSLFSLSLPPAPGLPGLQLSPSNWLSLLPLQGLSAAAPPIPGLLLFHPRVSCSITSSETLSLPPTPSFSFIVHLCFVALATELEKSVSCTSYLFIPYSPADVNTKKLRITLDLFAILYPSQWQSTAQYVFTEGMAARRNIRMKRTVMGQELETESNSSGLSAFLNSTGDWDAQCPIERSTNLTFSWQNNTLKYHTNCSI